MTDEHIAPSGDTVSIFICRRGQDRPRCSVPGCGRPATKLCDFKLTGAKTGKTCDRALCKHHALSVGVDVDFCPPHYELEQKRRAARAELPTISDAERKQ